MNSVSGKVITNEPICNVLQAKLLLFTLYNVTVSSSQDETEHWR